MDKVKEYNVSWHTHTFHGGLYKGVKKVYAHDDDQAAEVAQKAVWVSAFRDLNVGSIKIDKVERKFNR